MSTAQTHNNQPAWTPFQRGTFPPIDMSVVAGQADAAGATVEAVLALYDEVAKEDVWVNSRYQVNVSRKSPGVIHLSIKRRDKSPVHDWRDLQRIKNELVGPEHEAVEIYPAESRLVDTANQYHLFVFTDQSYRLPFGFVERMVTESPGGNAKQRPFEK